MWPTSLRGRNNQLKVKLMTDQLPPSLVFPRKERVTGLPGRLWDNKKPPQAMCRAVAFCGPWRGCKSSYLPERCVWPEALPFWLRGSSVLSAWLVFPFGVRLLDFLVRLHRQPFWSPILFLGHLRARWFLALWICGEWGFCPFPALAGSLSYIFS